MIITKANLTFAKPLIPLTLSNVEVIILHHIEATTAKPEDIHQWHLDNGWNGFGYNYYIKKDGTVYEGRGLNIGAQCQGMNSKSIGIALEGNYEVESTVPDVMMISLLDLINELKRKLPNKVTIEPHLKYTYTSCPGRFLFYLLPKIRECVEAFSGIDKLSSMKIFGSPDYWKQTVWMNMNPNSNYFKTALLNANNVL